MPALAQSRTPRPSLSPISADLGVDRETGRRHRLGDFGGKPCLPELRSRDRSDRRAASLVADRHARTYLRRPAVSSLRPGRGLDINIQAISGARRPPRTRPSRSPAGWSWSRSFYSFSQVRVCNVGESATVEATVTYRDGSALPSTDITSASQPDSGTVPMAVDYADSSGKTGRHLQFRRLRRASDGVTRSVTMQRLFEEHGPRSAAEPLQDPSGGRLDPRSSTFTTPRPTSGRADGRVQGRGRPA